jgi:signal peptidase II
MSRRNIIITSILAGVTVLDQVSKAAIAGSLVRGELVEVVPGFFNIVYWMNPGAAFGMLGDIGEYRIFLLAGVSVVALFIIGFLLYQYKDTLTVISLSMIAGGAVGNLIDRVRLGEVLDFLDFYVGAYHWPAFNVADSSISVGVVLLFYCMYLKPVDKKEETRKNEG